MLQRTAKSCGPDAPTLASSSRMLCRPLPGAGKTLIRWRRWQKSAVTGESTKETVKTIACGNAGRFRCARRYSCAFYTTKRTRGRGCSGHPAFPTPSDFGRKINAQLGRIARRGASVCLELEQTPSFRGDANGSARSAARWDHPGMTALQRIVFGCLKIE